MYEMVKLYELEEVINLCMHTGDFSQMNIWKKVVRERVWKTEILKWKASCMVYSELGIYRACVLNTHMHLWWAPARQSPHLLRQISCILAVLLGGQPHGMQRNLGQTICKLYVFYVGETVQSILYSSAHV